MFYKLAYFSHARCVLPDHMHTVGNESEALFEGVVLDKDKRFTGWKGRKMITNETSHNNGRYA